MFTADFMAPHDPIPHSQNRGAAALPQRLHWLDQNTAGIDWLYPATLETSGLRTETGAEVDRQSRLRLRVRCRPATFLHGWRLPLPTRNTLQAPG